MPMQPSPRAETSKVLFPSLRFCIISPRTVLIHNSKMVSGNAQKCSPLMLRKLAYFTRVFARSSGPLPLDGDEPDPSPGLAELLRSAAAGILSLPLFQEAASMKREVHRWYSHRLRLHLSHILYA